MGEDEVTPAGEVTELFGELGDGLIGSVIEGEEKAKGDGELLGDMLDHSMSSFNPDMMYEHLVNDYKIAEQIYGERILRAVTGETGDYLEKNTRIPEFQRELKERINECLQDLKKQDLIDKDLTITDKGVELASLVMYTEELERFTPHGYLGTKENKEESSFGETHSVHNYKKEDRYRDINMRKSLRAAIRRGHKTVDLNDMRVSEKKNKGEIYIIYALDASGSMKGEKIRNCKKAGIALAYRATMARDKVGLIVFGTNVKKEVMPTDDFGTILREIVTVRASTQTDIAKTIRRSIGLFPSKNVTKHLVIITDAMPTKGKKPKKETLKAVSNTRAHDITISVVGVELEKSATKLAREIAKLGKGKLYLADAKDVDKIVLEDYDSITSR